MPAMLAALRAIPRPLRRARGARVPSYWFVRRNKALIFGVSVVRLKKPSDTKWIQQKNAINVAYALFCEFEDG